jgi:hypothetical protein
MTACQAVDRGFESRRFRHKNMASPTLQSSARSFSFLASMSTSNARVSAKPRHSLFDRITVQAGCPFLSSQKPLCPSVHFVATTRTAIIWVSDAIGAQMAQQAKALNRILRGKSDASIPFSD